MGLKAALATIFLLFIVLVGAAPQPEAASGPGQDGPGLEVLDNPRSANHKDGVWVSISTLGGNIPNYWVCDFCLLQPGQNPLRIGPLLPSSSYRFKPKSTYRIHFRLDENEISHGSGNRILCRERAWRDHENYDWVVSKGPSFTIN